MTVAHERLFGRLFNTPLGYDARKAEVVVQGIGPRLAGTSVTIVNPEGGIDHTAFANGRPSAQRLGHPMGPVLASRDRPPFTVVEGIGVIPIEGTLVHKGAWLGANSGDTSYQGLLVQIAEAERRRDIRGVVFEIDSFGGEVSGAFETAAAIRRLSTLKPTAAILTDFAYSCGYLMASQARTVIAPPFGGAGSIGIITMHADFSGKLEKDGIAVTIIKSGAKKDAGSPFGPLDEDYRAQLQGVCDQMRDVFARHVARGRGSRFTKAAALRTEARAFFAAEALELGLIDAIGDPVEAFDAFISEVNRSPRT